jgi:hypothetical protein
VYHRHYYHHESDVFDGKRNGDCWALGPQPTLYGTPCTHIWWSREQRHGNVHVDSNAYGASFLFVPYANEGGAITFQHKSNPAVQVSHLVQVGEVIGGRWGRSHHFSLPFDGVCNSFVMYADF